MKLYNSKLDRIFYRALIGKQNKNNMIILIKNLLRQVTLISHNENTKMVVVQDNETNEQFIITSKEYNDANQSFNRTTNSRGFII